MTLSLGNSLTLRKKPNALDQRSSLRDRLTLKKSRLFDRHALELNHIARFELAQAVEIGGDDVGDVRVTAHRPASDAQHDQLSAGHLDRPGNTGAESRSGSEVTVIGIALEPQALRSCRGPTRNCRPAQKAAFKLGI